MPVAPAFPAAPEPAIDRTSLRLPPAQYFGETPPKNLILLHFTAGGSAKSAFDTWMGTPERVATPYIVERDGTIFEVFDPRFWAYHLGIPAKTGVPAGSQDRRAVAIEIVNVGPLRLDKSIAGQLNWWPGDFGRKWCTTADSGSYMAAPFRGFNHYAAFPEAQTQAVAALVRWLGGKFAIPRQLAPPERRMAYDLEYFRGFRGVAAHHNFRPDKFDLGPAFDWAKLNV